MTPGRSDPSVPPTIISTMAQVSRRPKGQTRLQKKPEDVPKPEVAQKRPAAVAQKKPEDVFKPKVAQKRPTAVAQKKPEDVSKPKVAQKRPAAVAQKRPAEA